MAKNKTNALGVIMTLVGVMVSLAVGFGMAGGALVVPYIPAVASVWSGWIVIMTTLL